MKYLTKIIATALILIAIPATVLAARTESSWLVSNDGSYIYPANPLNVLIQGVNRYLNFGTFSGSGGYGLRDNAGTIEFKNSGGSWTGIGSGGGGGSPASPDQGIQYNRSGAFAATSSLYYDYTGNFLHSPILKMDSHNIRMNNNILDAAPAITWADAGGGFPALLNGSQWTYGGSNIELNPDDQFIVMQNTGGGVRIGQEVVDTIPAGILESQYQDGSFGKNARLVSGNSWNALGGVGDSNGSSALYTEINDGSSHGGVFLSSYTDDDGSYFGVASMDSSAKNFFMGNVGIGTNTPNNPLDIQRNVNTDFVANVRNSSAGSSAYSEFRLGNDTGENKGGLALFGSGWTPSQLYNPNGIYVYNNTTGGITINEEAASYVRIGTNNTERVTVDSTGRVGIGTTTPVAKLAVENLSGAPTPLFIAASSTHAALVTIGANGSTTLSTLATPNCDVLATASGSLYCGTNGGGGGSPAGSSGQIQFNNAGAFGASTTLVYATSTGNVGIGTASPAEKLEVNGKVKLDGTVNSTLFSGAFTNFTGYSGFGVKNTSGNDALEVSTNGVVGFFGSEAFFAMGDRVLGGGYGNTYTGGFYKSNGVFSMYNNYLGQNTMSIADNGDTIIGVNPVSTYSGTNVSSTIGAGLVVDKSSSVFRGKMLISPAYAGAGTITDNGDNTVTFSVADTVHVGDIISIDDSGTSITITVIVDSFTAEFTGDGGSVSGSAYTISTFLSTSPLTINTAGGSGVDTISVNQTSAASGNYYSNLTFSNTNGLIANFSALGSGYSPGNIWGANDFVLLGGQGNNTTNMLFLTNTNGALKFGTGGYTTSNERMRITPTGSVGIGTTTPNATLSVNGSFALAHKTVNGNYTIATTSDQIIGQSTTTAASTITLPRCNASLTGSTTLIYTIKDEGGAAATFNITVARATTTDTIDGATSKVINTNYGAFDFYCGQVGKWFIK